MRDRIVSGRGSTVVVAPPDEVWSALLDPRMLQLLIPGAERVQCQDASHYDATLSFGVGRFRARYDAGLSLSNVDAPHSLDLAGSARGPFGAGRAAARVVLTQPDPCCTAIGWTYDGVVMGPVALAGRGPLQRASDVFVSRFFSALAKILACPTATTANVPSPIPRHSTAKRT